MSFLCCCCNNKSRKLTISDQEQNPAKTVGTFVQKQAPNGVRNTVSVQPGSTVTKIYNVTQTEVQPIRIHGSNHVGHSNHGFIPEHTPLPTLPSIPDDPIHKPTDINPIDQIISTQITVSSIGTPTHELEMETSQVVVDSSITTEWKKPDGGVIEMIPTIEESAMPSTSVTVGESHFESSQVLVDSFTKSSSERSENEHFDKTTIDKKSQIIVGSSSSDDINKIVSIQTTETATTVVSSAVENEIVGVQILPIIDDHRTEIVPKLADDGHGIGSSQIVVDSSIKTELTKTEGVEIIPSVELAPIQSKVNDSSQQNQMASSTQAITSTTVTKTETFGPHTTQMTSSSSTIPGAVVYQSTSAQPNIDSQISQIVTSIIANENAFGKKSIEPIPSTSTVHVTEVHQVVPSTVHVTEVHQVGPEHNLPSVDDELSEAFKDFVGGLMSTTPEARKIEPIFTNEQKQMDVTVVTAEAPVSMPADITVATTIEAAKDIISNEMAPSTTIQSDANDIEVIESIPSVVEVVTTQPTSTGYEETKVIATKFTSDGPTFLEVSKTGFHTENTMTSSVTELHSTQVVSKSTFSYEDDQLISTSTVSNDGFAVEKNETPEIQISGSEQTFKSFTEFSSSSTQIVSSPDQETFKFMSSSPINEDGPTIIEISSTTIEPSSPPTATTYIVSEPSYDYESGGSSPAADYGGSSYSYDDTTYDDCNDYHNDHHDD